MANIQQFVCMSGLPRTGSTLLSAILSQNPNIHSEGNSAVCQLMVDMDTSCKEACKEQLTANNRESTRIDLIKSIPNVYYKNVTAPIVVDKCRHWTIPENQVLYNYITDNPKTIVLTRPTEEIIKSLIHLHEENNYGGNLEQQLIATWIPPIIHSINGIKWAKQNNNGEFLFVTYEELVTQTSETIKKIYSFCEWESFDHDYNEIVNQHPENDHVYNLLGMHDVRSTISKRNLNTQLSPAMLKKCRDLDLY
jgi:sulfotransferase